MAEKEKPKPRGRPRKREWPEPIPDDPENIMRILMRTPREALDEVNTETEPDSPKGG